MVDFISEGSNDKALFTLKLHRGEGMVLIAMNWKTGKPTNDFVGFSIEYKEPGGTNFYAVKNRISFPDAKGKLSPVSLPSLQAPIQKFRWVHFPFHPDLAGMYTYKIKPVFMNDKDELSYGEPQQADIQLGKDTYPNQLNVCFTRGFISSQAFIDNYGTDGGVSTLLPALAKNGLAFTTKNAKAPEAWAWMGFEARAAILDLLDNALADTTAKVSVVAYDFNEPEIVDRLEKLGTRLTVIIDDSGEHGNNDSAETAAATRLNKSTKGNMKRQHMNNLQHNKTIIVNGNKLKAAVCGSTNFSWRGLYVQANNAVVVYGAKAIQPFQDAFDSYWKYDSVNDYGKTGSADWNNLSLTGIDAQVTFSPHLSNNAKLDSIAKDMTTGTSSSLFYSLAFLYQTTGSIRDAITKLTASDKIFVYGISDKIVGGIVVQNPDGNLAPVYPSALAKNLPEPFKSEPTGGGGTRMHHKFVVIDFDKPTARVYFGSYNFSPTADTKNGENLLVIKDRKVATSYMIEAVSLFDHYEFRIAQANAKKAKTVVSLSRPPRNKGDVAWWDKYYSQPRRVKDRQLFA